MKTIFLGNNTDWLPGMLNDYKQLNEVSFYNSEYPGKYDSLFGKFFRWFVLSPRKSGSLRKLFFPVVARYLPARTYESFIIVIFDRNVLGLDRLFLDYLRDRYKNVKLVYIFTNAVRKSYAWEQNKVGVLLEWYDIVYTFEPDDAKDFGFTFSQLFNAGFAKREGLSVKNRVFFVGHAKDRLPRITSVYQRLKEIGVDSLFYVTGVPSDFLFDSQTFICNHPIPYTKTQEIEKDSTCILEILQGGAKGLTLKARSALCNDKLLITDNQYIKNEPFYNPDYILVIEKPEDITLSFFNTPERVHYTECEKDYLSLSKFIDKMKYDLHL